MSRIDFNISKMVGVTLGMPGPWADSNYEAADHYTTKIGGVPDWPFPITRVKPDMLECNDCGSHRCLIAQVYAPVSSKSLAIEERVIYVFSCLAPRCESVLWRALRVQKNSSVKEAINTSNEVVNGNESSVSVSNNDWLCDESDDDIDLQELGKALSEAASIASIGRTQHTNNVDSRKPLITDQPARSIDDKVPVMPCFYTYTQEEKLLKNVTPESLKDPLLSAKESENSSEDDSSGEIYEEESYEYDRALNADRTYLKFKKRLDAYQEQCFRYSYGGRPLLPSGEAGDPGNCSLCGGPRHYEMQLMPPVIYFLQEAADNQQKSSLEKFDWMTLLVYTCSESCANPLDDSDEGWIVAEEAVIVQHE